MKGTSFFFALQLACAGLFLSAPLAQAEVLFRPAFTYTIDKTEQNSTTTTTRRVIDIGAGYVGNEGWMILGMYGMENKTVDDGTNVHKIDRNSMGLGGGYMQKGGGFYVDGIYFIQSEMTIGSTKHKGDGWQIDLGYNFNFSRVGLGAQLTYRSFKYTKAGEATLTPPLKQTNLDPMFALVMAF